MNHVVLRTIGGFHRRFERRNTRRCELHGNHGLTIERILEARNGNLLRNNILHCLRNSSLLVLAGQDPEHDLRIGHPILRSAACDRQQSTREVLGLQRRFLIRIENIEHRCTVEIFCGSKTRIVRTALLIHRQFRIDALEREVVQTCRNVRTSYDIHLKLINQTLALEVAAERHSLQYVFADAQFRNFNGITLLKIEFGQSRLTGIKIHGTLDRILNPLARILRSLFAFRIVGIHHESCILRAEQHATEIIGSNLRILELHGYSHRVTRKNTNSVLLAGQITVIGYRHDVIGFAGLKTIHHKALLFGTLDRGELVIFVFVLSLRSYAICITGRVGRDKSK